MKRVKVMSFVFSSLSTDRCLRDDNLLVDQGDNFVRTWTTESTNSYELP